MPFYLRKALSFGPIRLNLSKHGVGASGGVTGARVGTGPKGAYVHGGRHGLYYRKYASEGKKEGKADGKTRAGTDGEERYFVDTGVTYEKDSGSNPERERPAPPTLPGPGKAVATTAIGLFVLIIGQLSVIGGLGLLASIGGLYWGYRIKQDKKNAEETLKKLKQGLEEQKDTTTLLQELEERSLTPKARHYIAFHFYRECLGHFLEDPSYPTPEQFGELESKLELPEETVRQEKRFAFSALLDEVMEDHLIDAEEEEHLETLQANLDLQDDDIPEEKQLIHTMTKMRRAMEKTPEPRQVDVNLKEGEECYWSAEGRFLKEKIQDRYQRDRIVYKAIGYEIDMEGTLYLTDRRLLLVGRGSRDYELRDVLDVTLSLKENILELVLDGRKNPVIVSTPEVAVLCGKMEKLLEAED